MRHTGWRAAVSLAAALSGCGPVLSLHPLYREKHPMPALAGSWGDGESRYVVRARGAADYDVEVATHGKTGKYQVCVARLEESLFADCTQELREGTGIPGHFFVRMRLEQDGLHVAPLDAGWVKRRLEQTGANHYTITDHGIILTGPTVELQTLMREWSRIPEAFEKETILKRTP
jgi:hypothetical protein